MSPGFEPVRDAFAENFTRRRELGGACCVYHRGEKVVDLWGGVRNESTGAPWKEDTMVLVYSATKGPAAMTLAVGNSRGWLGYDERVCTYWPAFAQRGKEAITIRELLARQAGLFALDALSAPAIPPTRGFHVPAEKLDRLAGCYAFNRQTHTLEVFDDAANSQWRVEPPFESGGGGLVSTIDDYCAFSRMMLNKGRLGRERILSRASVELMTSDQLTPEQRTGAEIFFGEHSSWGLGMAVDIARREIFHSPGRFGWNGGFGTTAYVDPAEQMIGILFTQRMMDSPVVPKVTSDFWTLAYGAME